MRKDSIDRSLNASREDLKPGEVKWYVSTMGVPGEERVISVSREERFADGRNPTVQSVEHALREKYGTPTESRDERGERKLTWAYDPLGRLVTETSPLFPRCRLDPDPDGAVNLTPDCGVVVAAVIEPLPTNPDLGLALQVGVVDQAGGFESITATEQALAAKDADRRAKEVEEASERADAPKL